MTTPQHKNDSEEKHVVYTEDASQQPHSLSSGDQEQQQPGKVIKSPEELAYIRKLNITVLPLMMAIIFVQVRICVCRVLYDLSLHIIHI